jgi:hypothetical protein
MPAAPLPFEELEVGEEAGEVAVGLPDADMLETADANGTLEAVWHCSVLFDGVVAFEDRVKSAHWTTNQSRNRVVE